MMNDRARAHGRAAHAVVRWLHGRPMVNVSLGRPLDHGEDSVPRSRDAIEETIRRRLSGAVGEMVQSPVILLTTSVAIGRRCKNRFAWRACCRAPIRWTISNHVLKTCWLAFSSTGTSWCQAFGFPDISVPSIPRRRFPTRQNFGRARSRFTRCDGDGDRVDPEWAPRARDRALRGQRWRRRGTRPLS